jgi:hypothetical protein
VSNGKYLQTLRINVSPNSGSISPTKNVDPEGKGTTAPGIVCKYLPVDRE